MTAAPSIWDKLSRIVIVLLVAAGVIGIVRWYSPLVSHNEWMRKEQLELDRQIAMEMDAARKLDAQIRSLQDPRTIERLARERLSYARPGETIIYFEPSAPSRRQNSIR